jgi:hypothetical protein
MIWAEPLMIDKMLLKSCAMRRERAQSFLLARATLHWPAELTSPNRDDLLHLSMLRISWMCRFTASAAKTGPEPSPKQ